MLLSKRLTSPQQHSVLEFNVSMWVGVGGANLVFEVEAASIEDGPQIIHLDADNMPVYSEPDTAFLEL